jgi:hypothetical protein
LEQVICDTLPIHRSKYNNYYILYAIFGSLVNSIIAKYVKSAKTSLGKILHCVQNDN